MPTFAKFPPSTVRLAAPNEKFDVRLSFFPKPLDDQKSRATLLVRAPPGFSSRGRRDFRARGEIIGRTRAAKRFPARNVTTFRTRPPGSTSTAGAISPRRGEASARARARHLPHGIRTRVRRQPDREQNIGSAKPSPRLPPARPPTSRDLRRRELGRPRAISILENRVEGKLSEEPEASGEAEKKKRERESVRAIVPRERAPGRSRIGRGAIARPLCATWCNRRAVCVVGTHAEASTRAASETRASVLFTLLAAGFTRPRTASSARTSLTRARRPSARKGAKRKRSARALTVSFSTMHIASTSMPSRLTTLLFERVRPLLLNSTACTRANTTNTGLAPTLARSRFARFAPPPLPLRAMAIVP